MANRPLVPIERIPENPPPGGSRLEANSSEQMQAAGTLPAARAGGTEGKGAPHPGKGRPSLWLPGLLRPGKAQNAGATESALLWNTGKLELHSMQGPLHIEQPGA